MNYQNTRFLKSAAQIHQLPPDIGREVAFAGRSNAGKSSALNALTGIGKLAHTSKTPGRTQLINLFELSSEARLVDLPGYGYAKVSHSKRKEWGVLLMDFITWRQCLRGIVLIMDIRHPFKEQDVSLIMACPPHCSIHVLLTKCDKLSKSAGMATLKKVHDMLSNFSVDSSAQLFSAPKKIGIDEAQARLNHWFEEDLPAPQNDAEPEDIQSFLM